MSLPRYLRRCVAVIAAAALVSSGGLLAVGGVAHAAGLAKPLHPTPNDTGVIHKDVVLTADSVLGATSYDVQVTTDGNFTNPILSVNVPTPRYVPTVALPHADYLWRIRAANSAGKGVWSVAAAFTRGWDAAPTNLGYASATGVFSWTPIGATGSTGGAASYDVQFSTSPDFGVHEQSKLGFLCRTNHPWWTDLAVADLAETDTQCRPLTGSAAAASGLPAGTYYWRVRGLDDTSAAALGSDADPVNGAGCAGISYEALDSDPRWDPSDAPPECSRWSASAAARVTIRAVGAGNNPNPSAAPQNITTGCPTAACTNDTPVISWDSMGAPSYEVYIGTDASFSSYSYVYTTQTPAVAPRISVPDRQMYYVLVHACYDDGCGAAGVDSFTKVSNPVETTTPEMLTGTSPVLSWTDYLRTTETLEAKAYHIQVGTSADLADSTPTVDVTVDRAGEPYGTSTYQPTGLQGGAYFWRVQAIDASDRGLTWSSPRAFRVGSSAVPVETWDPDPTSRAFGGGYAKSATRNATETLKLYGPSDPTSVILYGVTSSSGGWAHIYAGGAYQTAVSFYSPATAWRHEMWRGTIPELSAGEAYAVQVVVQGTRPAESHGSYVYLDQWTVGTDTYQEAATDLPNARHSVADAWSRQVATDAANGIKTVIAETANAAYVGSQLATATAHVVGRTVTVRLCRSPAAGYADIVVDAVRKATVSLYQSYTSCGYAAYTASLTAGEHTVSVGVTGRIPSGSRGSAVAVDMISVT